MAESFGILVVIFLLAFLTEASVEYVLGTPIDKLGLAKYKWLLMYASFLLGVGLAFWYKVDIVYILAQAVGAEAVDAGPVGYALTGFGIGRGANWMHQLVSTYFPGKE